MISELPIRDEAAFVLCPKNRAEGISELDKILAIISMNIRRLDLFLKTLIAVMIVVAGLSMLSLAITDHTHKPRNFVWALFILSSITIGAALIVWLKIQHSKFGLRLARVQGAMIPDCLKELIAAYANDEKRAFTNSGTVPSGLFASHWAILLFSKEPEWRGWVRSSDGRRETKEIYTAVSHRDVTQLKEQMQLGPAIDIETSAPSYKNCIGDHSDNYNVNPDHQWIVGGSRAEYEACRDQAFADLPPSVANWKSFVLDGIRHELRRGGQPGAIGSAVREIQQELERVFGHKLTPNQKPSKAQIQRMASTGKDNVKLRGYFNTNRPE